MQKSMKRQFSRNSSKKLNVKSREMLFGCSVCANVVLDKRIQKPFIVTTNSKIKNNLFVPPPSDFAKTLKTEVDYKIGHEFWRFVPHFDKVSLNPCSRYSNKILFREHSNVNYEI